MLRTKAQQQAILTIKNEQALVKIIQATLGDDQHWDFTLNQLADPQHFRPYREHSLASRQRVFNPLTGEWYQREVGKQGASKNTPFTKKTATSVLPDDGRLNFYSQQHGVGLLLDEKGCDLRDGKYVFPENANTDSRWWLMGRNARSIKRSVPIKEIRASQRALKQRNRIPYHSEVLARLTVQAVAGVFAPRNDLITRLNTLRIAKKNGA